MAYAFILLLILVILYPVEAVAGLFGPSAGEEAAMIVGVVFGVPALVVVVVVALFFRHRAKLAEMRVRSFLVSETSRFDIFLSYSAKDRSQAKQLSELLQQSNLKVYFADKNLEGGSPFTDEIRAALHDSRELWVLATPSSVDSVWVATEWGTAWALQRRIVPILLNVTKDRLPDRLRALHAVSFSKVTEEVQRAQKRVSTSTTSITETVPSLWKKIFATILVLYLLWLFFA